MNYLVDIMIVGDSASGHAILDKIAVTKVPDYCNVIKEELDVPEEIDIIPISSTKKSNLETIWQVISEIL